MTHRRNCNSNQQGCLTDLWPLCFELFRSVKQSHVDFVLPSLPRKFVRCSVRTCVRHIQQLLRNKLTIPSTYNVSVIYWGTNSPSPVLTTSVSFIVVYNTNNDNNNVYCTSMCYCLCQVCMREILQCLCKHIFTIGFITKLYCNIIRYNIYYITCTFSSPFVYLLVLQQCVSKINTKL